ncbi:MAG: hypothetical protein ABIQ26_06435, partial [Streptosporangiaceae bacterium]
AVEPVALAGLFGAFDADDAWRMTRRSYVLLGELMKRTDLPPLEWSISKWSVQGKPDHIESNTTKRLEVEAWAQAMGFRVREWQCQGYTRLFAGGKRPVGSREVGLSFCADLYDEPADQVGGA